MKYPRMLIKKLRRRIAALEEKLPETADGVLVCKNDDILIRRDDGKMVPGCLMDWDYPKCPSYFLVEEDEGDGDTYDIDPSDLFSRSATP